MWLLRSFGGADARASRRCPPRPPAGRAPPPRPPTTPPPPAARHARSREAAERLSPAILRPHHCRTRAGGDAPLRSRRVFLLAISGSSPAAPPPSWGRSHPASVGAPGVPGGARPRSGLLPRCTPPLAAPPRRKPRGFRASGCVVGWPSALLGVRRAGRRAGFVARRAVWLRRLPADLDSVRSPAYAPFPVGSGLPSLDPWVAVVPVHLPPLLVLCPRALFDVRRGERCSFPPAEGDPCRYPGRAVPCRLFCSFRAAPPATRTAFGDEARSGPSHGVHREFTGEVHAFPIGGGLPDALLGSAENGIPASSPSQALHPPTWAYGGTLL